VSRENNFLDGHVVIYITSLRCAHVACMARGGNLMREFDAFEM
jgi:hypothetical protein